MTSVYLKCKLLKEVKKLKSQLLDYIVKNEPDAYKRLLNKLQSLMVNSYNSQRRKALTEAIGYMLDITTPSLTTTDVKYINDIFINSLGSDLATMQEENIIELNEKVFKHGITVIGDSLDLELSFGINDVNSASILGKQNLFWIGNYYTRQLNTDIDEILRGYSTEGKTIEEVAKDFEKNFNDKTDKGETYFEGLAHHTTTTVRNLGKITGLEKAGAKGYRVVAVIDDRTSDICLEMNGKEFLLDKGIEYRDKILSLTNPDDIKNVSEWLPVEDVQGLSPDELPLGMSLPPYHYGGTTGCRTTVEAIF